MGKSMYYETLIGCAEVVLKSEDERMKMELANIILTTHSDDKSLVRVLRRYFFAEHLFSDLHLDRPLFRWHPCNSYIDSAYVKRVKDIEASKSDEESGSISGQATANIRSFGDLMEDPLVCILGSPGCSNMESNNPPENKGTLLKRSELRARRRSHRQQHRYADKLAVS